MTSSEFDRSSQLLLNFKVAYLKNSRLISNQHEFCYTGPEFFTDRWLRCVIFDVWFSWNVQDYCMIVQPQLDKINWYGFVYFNNLSRTRRIQMEYNIAISTNKYSYISETIENRHIVIQWNTKWEMNGDIADDLAWPFKVTLGTINVFKVNISKTTACHVRS